MRRFPESRLQIARDLPPDRGGSYVLYWMTAARRAGWNHALQRAADWAEELDRPLLILEALRAGYRWASDRLHAFVLQGMADNAGALDGGAATYVPYVEPEPGAGRGLVEALASRAAVVVGDLSPVFFLPRMVRAAARRVRVRFELVDSCGILPLSASEHPFPTAHAFRRHLQRELRPHLEESPRANPLARRDLRRLPRLPEPFRRWRPATTESLAEPARLLASLPIDHAVAPVATRGGTQAGRARLTRFLAELPRYGEERNHPDDDAGSGLSPYLHFGHVSPHEVFARLAKQEGWTAARLASNAAGRRAGWWGMSPAAEGFLDQLITWRELGQHRAFRVADHDRYGSLPAWARRTLAKHAGDPRPQRYTLRQLEGARTHDELWNAAQRQLLREGTLHNYLRMLWGKKVLEWTSSPQRAVSVLFRLNDRYALDGRDPNSSSGILWCLGLFDRPWGPERPIFGTVRYMTTANTLRKLRCGRYLERHADRGGGHGGPAGPV